MIDSMGPDQARFALSSGLAARGLPGGAHSLQAAQAKAVEFEAQFLSQMLAPMFDTLGAEEPFGGGVGEEMWRSMQVQEFGKGLANSGGIGLADSVLGELLALQAKENGQ